MPSIVVPRLVSKASVWSKLLANWNIHSIFVTLLVSKASAWLKLVAERKM